METIFTIVCGLFLLCFLVFIHELGHFLVARAEGVRVTEFFLGMPCKFRLFRRSKKYGTKYGVTPLLVGGYNKICGMEGTLTEADADILGYVQSHGRVSVDDVSSALGKDREDVFSTLITLCDWASIEPYYDESKGENPNQSEYPETFQTVMRDEKLRTEYDKGFDRSGDVFSAGSIEPITSNDEFFTKERARTYQGQSYPKKLAVLFAGPVVNLVFGVLALTIGIMTVGGVRPIPDTTVLGGVQSGSVAEAGGILAGDEVLSVNGVSVTDWNSITSAINECRKSGEPFDIEIVRDGEVMHFSFNGLSENQYLGIEAASEKRTYSFTEAVGEAFGYMATAARAVAGLLIPTEMPNVVSNSTSVVGITVMAGQAASRGIFQYILITAMVSVSLGLANLLPIPPLDGGRIVVETIQRVRRRPLAQRTMRVIETVGVACFFLLFIVVLQQDIVKYFFS